MYNFYSVTLIENKKTIERCLYNLNNLYPKKFEYKIICPEISCPSFQELCITKNIQIISEDSILSFSQFKKIALNIAAYIGKKKIEK